MDPQNLKEMLERVRKGTLSPDEAAKQLAGLPYEDLGFAKVDHHRALRRGFPEAVFAHGLEAGFDSNRVDYRMFSIRTISVC